MKSVAEMSNEELAAHVSQTLHAAGVTVTLTGGACVAIWSDGKYVSDDLDFIEEGPVPPRTVVTALASIGFARQGKGRHFIHPDTKFYVEFPQGPLMVGDQRVEHVSERHTSTGKLRLLSPTDCVKDRLSAFFHWNDRQGLEQAIMVANAQQVDLGAIRRWSKAERNEEKFAIFEKRVASRPK